VAARTLFRSGGVAEAELEEQEGGLHGLVYLVVMGGHEGWEWQLCTEGERQLSPISPISPICVYLYTYPFSDCFLLRLLLFVLALTAA
jgi:hypothetical protein